MNIPPGYRAVDSNEIIIKGDKRPAMSEHVKNGSDNISDWVNTNLYPKQHTTPEERGLPYIRKIKLFRVTREEKLIAELGTNLNKAIQIIFDEYPVAQHKELGLPEMQAALDKAIEYAEKRAAKRNEK